MKERIDDSTPALIRELFLAPYREFSYQYWRAGCRSLLDVGCGQGYGTSIASGFFDVVVGIDKAGGQVRCDVTNICFPDNSFDAVFCFEVIEHLNAGDQELLLQELWRVCRKGFVLGSVNKVGDDYIGGVEIYKGSRNPFHLKEFAYGEFVQMVDRFKWAHTAGTLYQAGRLHIVQGPVVQPLVSYLCVTKNF